MTRFCLDRFERQTRDSLRREFILASVVSQLWERSNHCGRCVTWRDLGPFARIVVMQNARDAADIALDNR